MKRVILILVFALSNFCFSQEKGTKQINLSVGTLSSNDFVRALGFVATSPIVSINKKYGYTEENDYKTPIVNLTFKYAIIDNLFLDADYSFQKTRKKSLKDDVIMGYSSDDYHSFGFGAEYHFLNKKIVQLYSGLSLGCTFQNNYSDFYKSENDLDFNFHLNAIGVRVGKKIAGTAELGFGYKGLINLGVSYQF